jgi:hypothetical protein
MFRNRWIRVPLLGALIWGGCQVPVYLLFSEPVPIWYLLLGSLFFGFFIEGYSWLRIQYKYGPVTPQALEPHQVRTFTLLQSKGRAFKTCQAAIKAIPRLTLRESDPDRGTLTVRPYLNAFNRRSNLTVRLSESSDHLTEVHIELRPVWRGVLVDNGEGWKTVEQLVSAVKALDTEPTIKSLNDGASMLQDLTTRPINFTR